MQITDSDGETVTSYDEATEKLQINSNEEQLLTVNGSIVNNFETTLSDVVIVGRIPFVGNQDGNGNDLGTNFDTSLENSISTSGAIADVYYSEDGLADLNSDSWISNPEKVDDFKSYKIVLREKNLAKGERLSFEYSLEVPENVSYNSKAYSNYTTYYKIDTQNYQSGNAVGMFTETRGVELDDINEDNIQDVTNLIVGTEVSQGRTTLTATDSVFERQILKYTVVVRNTSNKTLNNVVVKGSAENANLYYLDS